ncbi:MAG: nickel pincer cofactor biosynthesis protein LarC [Acidobacteriota bacterium]
MRVYHLDCPSGLAGDMFLGACLDLGLPEATLAAAIASLGLPGVGIEIRRAKRGGIAGTRFRVLQDGNALEATDEDESAAGALPPDSPDIADAGASAPSHTHAPSHEHKHVQSRGLAEIRGLIERSGLAAEVRERATLLFVRLGEAEAHVHGTALDRVHFHEVGAVDSIVDLVGAAVAWQWLASERLTCGPVNVGGGTVSTAHGRLPVPAPATARLLEGIPVYGGGDKELLTPTGAVLLAELVDEFRALPAMVIEGSGYGLGRRELADRPNAARLLCGRADASPVGAEVQVVECEIDDLSGEGFGFLIERLLAAGALDVFFTSVQMKKNRPGTLVTLLCRRPQLESLAAVLLAESGSLGCRYHAASRFEAEREIVVVETSYGPVRVKRATFGGRSLGAAPEFEDCRRIALERGVPWREVHRAALLAASSTERA